ncbi:hypothetical protein AUQ48_08950 [Kocuria flava]|uniref:Uncharacterized protein n=1 Tax=Kocuria flava TaxID=446860 RepID=A0A2N4T286_9MICC|nr:hypothetical protein AUQ48_08950 [Kocuria flava]
MAVGAAVALDAHGAHVGEQDDRHLPDLLVEPGAGKLLAGDRVRAAQHREAVLGDLADDADAQAGAGEGLAADDLLGQAELAAHGADLVLEQGPQRLHELELQVLGQPAHVVVALDVGRALPAAGLDDVGVEGALDEEAHGLALLGGAAGDLLGGGLEGADELAADDLALLLGIGHPGEGAEEALLLLGHVQPHAGGGHEVGLDLLGLALAQQPVVDEHAGELVADRALDERGGHGGVDAAGEPADHGGGADLLADALDVLLDDVAGGPAGLDPGAGEQEALEDLLAVHGVLDLGVPLHAVEPALLVGKRRHGRGLGGGEHLEAGGGLDHGVAVAHPHRLGAGRALEDRGVHGRGGGRPVLAGPGVGHRPPRAWAMAWKP